MTEYEKEYNKKLQEKKNKTESEVDSIFGITTDTLKPGEDNKQEFARNFNMFGKYKDSINELRNQINQLMKRDTSLMLFTVSMVLRFLSDSRITIVVFP